MFLGEVIGTGVLVLLGDGVVAGVLLNKSKAQNGGWIVITFAWAMAVLMGVLSSIAVTGGVAHINPAVTIGFAAIDVTEWSDVPQLIAGQFLGAFIGATLVWLSYLAHWPETDDKGLKLAVFCTGPAIRNTVANLITEIIGTMMLVLGVLAIGRTDTANALGFFFVALLVLGIGQSLGGPTGYAINPARDLGPRIMHFVLPIAGKGDSDWQYAWIPVVGPIIGGVIGALIAKAAFDL
ncbi:MAG TPA: MIP/aquaporin family protein [Actinomycetota bacterium]|jgi:glycerol uptake facilitator protein|nr:MIP/aquaporin family protein [Actinomycetota bacterium]